MYNTVSQDMFDFIAYKTLGNCTYTGEIMDANINHLQTFRFNAGVNLNIPTIDKSADISNLPPWKRS